MRNNWLWFMDLDGESPYIFPVDHLTSYGLGGQLFSQIFSFMDDSLYHCRSFSVTGSLAVEGAFNHISKIAGALLFLFSRGSSSNIRKEITGNPQGSKPRGLKTCSQVMDITSSRKNFRGFHCRFRSKGKSTIPFIDKISSFLLKPFEAQQLQLYPMLSLAAALVPPFDDISSKVLAVPLGNTDVMVQRKCCEVEHQGYTGLSIPDLNWRRHTVEPRTGIEFPNILDNILAEESNPRLTSEILVGTGSRTMKIIKIKSLKVYAFGFYIHPSTVCEKLGSKYASISVDELNKCREFYEDLLREDINMTVRLVVSCNGMKINTVRDAFEKSLRARLVKTNPGTDFNCIETFGSHFTKDIPLPAGTTIDFRQTAEGQLITEIGGNQIGAVHSKDLCRAFFGMYIGDVPVSEQTKEEIGRNVASLITRC